MCAWKGLLISAPICIDGKNIYGLTESAETKRISMPKAMGSQNWWRTRYSKITHVAMAMVKDYDIFAFGRD